MEYVPSLAYASAVALGDALYVFGGYDDASNYNSLVYKYTPAIDKWEKVAVAHELRARHHRARAERDLPPPPMSEVSESPGGRRATKDRRE